MPRILYVIENIFFGGGERAFAQIINGLDKEKFEIYAACRPGGVFEERIKDSARILPFDLRNRFSLARIRRLVGIIRENNIQIVHSQGGRADFFARIAAGLAGAPAVVSTVAMPVEGYDVGFLRKAVYVLSDRFSERFVDRFVVVSEALRERLVRRHRIAPEKISVISNGIEVGEYCSSSKPVYDLRDELKIGPGVQLVGVIGRLVWQKGLSYFIRAAKLIVGAKQQAEGEVRFLIVGEGDERGKLEGLVSKLGIKEDVIFTGFRKDVKEILQALDILVLPSVREGQPIILLEAMAMATPVVATDIEGVNETVVDGVTGALVPPKDSQALARAIVSLLNNSKKAQELGQAGRRAAEERFNIRDKIEQHQRLYEAVLAGKSGS